MKLMSIASGSSGNCIYAGTDNSHILIDAGISGKKIEEGLHSIDLKAEDMQGILITHEHLDHIKGLGVLARRYGIPIYGTAGTIEYMLTHDCIGKVDDGLFHTICPDEDFTIGDMTITAMSTSHDAADPVAYMIKKQQKSMAVITDLGTYDDSLVDKLQGLDVLLLEANHDIHMLQAGGYPYYLKRRILGDKGHLSNELSGQLLGKLLHDDFKHVLLGHLSQENNFPELAYETVKLEVTLGDNPYKGTDFNIQVATRDKSSPLISI